MAALLLTLRSLALAAHYKYHEKGKIAIYVALASRRPVMPGTPTKSVKALTSRRPVSGKGSARAPPSPRFGRLQLTRRPELGRLDGRGRNRRNMAQYGARWRSELAVGAYRASEVGAASAIVVLGARRQFALLKHLTA